MIIQDLNAFESVQVHAILFDLDGVIVDSEPLHHRAWREALQKFIGEDLSWDQFIRDFFGRADTEVVKAFSQKFKGKLEDILACKNDVFCKNLDQIPTASGVLAYIQDKKHKLPKGLVSNALWVEVSRMLEQLRLLEVFDTVVTADRIKKPKPAPDPYLKGFEALRQKKPSLTKEHVLVIEDSDIGVASASSAGMGFILQRSFGHEDIIKLLQQLEN